MHFKASIFVVIMFAFGQLFVGNIAPLFHWINWFVTAIAIVQTIRIPRNLVIYNAFYSYNGKQ